MLNPDGVALGNYRCCSRGYDLNRFWIDPSPIDHPTIYAAKELILKLNELHLEFFIDIHAHSSLMNGFIYGNSYDDKDRFEQQDAFPKLLGQNVKDFSLVNTEYNNDKKKSGTGRR